MTAIAIEDKRFLIILLVVNQHKKQENGYNNDDESNIKEEYDPNRKFDHRTRLIDKRNMLNGLAY